MEKKKPIKKIAAPKKSKEKAPSPKKYIFAIGRRKTATSRVKMTEGGEGKLVVNGRAFIHYFPTEFLQKIVFGPLTALGMEKTIDADIRVSGGGTRSQALATALGLARALVARNADSKTVLKKHGLLTRDARKKERKKPGLKRARRAPQWQKR